MDEAAQVAPDTAEGNKKTNWVVWVLVLAGVVAVIGGYLTFKNESTESVSMVEPSPTGAAPTAAAMEEKEVVTVEIEAGSFFFEPNNISVKQGDKVKIVLKSRDMMHNFSLDEFGVNGPITKAGGTSTVEFTANKSGEFEFYCAVDQHRKNGLVGKITVI